MTRVEFENSFVEKALTLIGIDDNCTLNSVLLMTYELFHFVDNEISDKLALIGYYATLKTAFIEREKYLLVHEVDFHLEAKHNVVIGDSIPTLIDKIPVVDGVVRNGTYH